MFGLEGDSGSNRFMRLPRLYRIGRITRVLAGLRILKAGKLVQNNHFLLAVYRVFGHSKAMNLLKFMLMLIELVHLLGCGWYLTAALDPNPERTWVGRRIVNGAPLIDYPEVYQWITSSYFVLTVFTTVGFGDISAIQASEIVYVMFLQLLGAIVNSMVISQVISVITSGMVQNDRFAGPLGLLKTPSTINSPSSARYRDLKNPRFSPNLRLLPKIMDFWARFCAIRRSFSGFLDSDISRHRSI